MILMRKVLVIHGGAGYWRRERLERALNFLKIIAEEGMQILNNRGALDAVEHVIRRMEESPIFNAGRGAVPNLFGEIELDAGIMKSDGNAGFVAGVKNVLHAISLARIVMEETDHLMLIGEGATLLAKLKGLSIEMKELFTERTIKLWQETIQDLLKMVSGEQVKAENEVLSRILSYYPRLISFLKRNEKYVDMLRKKMEYGDTVGAVAFDGKYLVAGTSTGGLLLKLPGRVGDTPLPGAGTYADEYGAASATGVGEEIIKAMLTKNAVGLLHEIGANKAAKEIFYRVERKIKVRAGIILIDSNGEWGIYHTTPYFPCAIVSNDNIRVGSVWRE